MARKDALPGKNPLLQLNDWKQGWSIGGEGGIRIAIHHQHAESIEHLIANRSADPAKMCGTWDTAGTQILTRVVLRFRRACRESYPLRKTSRSHLSSQAKGPRYSRAIVESGSKAFSRHSDGQNALNTRDWKKRRRRFTDETSGEIGVIRVESDDH